MVKEICDVNEVIFVVVSGYAEVGFDFGLFGVADVGQVELVEFQPFFAQGFADAFFDDRFELVGSHGFTARSRLIPV